MPSRSGVFPALCIDGAHAPPLPNFQTGMPSFLALSPRLSWIPVPGNTMTPIGSTSSIASARRNGAEEICHKKRIAIECDAANFTPAGVVIATEVPGSTVKPEDGQLTPASENAIREAVREGYRTNDRPNVNELVPLVQRALKKSGKKASKVQIQKIAVEREFAAQRRRQGEHRPRRPRSTLDNTEPLQ